MRVTAERYLSLQEVGDELGVTDQTVRRWVKAGELAAYKPGKEYRIKGSDLDEFMQTREVSPKGREPQPKFRAAAQPEEWQESLARLYKATIKEGRAALKTQKPNFERVRVFDKFAARLAEIHGPRDILGREADALAEAVAELEDVQDQVQTRLQEWFVDAPEEDRRYAREQMKGTQYEVVLNAAGG